jgi:hypothetical protein
MLTSRTAHAFEISDTAAATAVFVRATAGVTPAPGDGPANASRIAASSSGIVVIDFLEKDGKRNAWSPRRTQRHGVGHYDELVKRPSIKN